MVFDVAYLANGVLAGHGDGLAPDAQADVAEEVAQVHGQGFQAQVASRTSTISIQCDNFWSF